MAKSPRITVLQPDPEVDLDSFKNWLSNAGIRLSIIGLWEKDVPALTAIGDGCIVLGGKHSAYAENYYPWLPKVKDLLADLHSLEIPILGICLGHQILATALGGTVNVADKAGGEKTPTLINWLPSAKTDSLFQVFKEHSIFYQSHEDVVTVLPEGAIELGYSAKYRNQAFNLGTSWGVQFHPEASFEKAISWARNDFANPEKQLIEIAKVREETGKNGQKLAHAFSDYVRNT